MSRLAVAALAALLPLHLAAADEPEVSPLRFDPFSGPALEGSGGPTRPVARGAWTPVLRATLVAGPDSLANLGGIVLRLGEEAHGYRLVEVREWEAVFERGGVRRVFALDAEGAEAGEEP